MFRAAVLPRFLVALWSFLCAVVLLGPGEVAAGKGQKGPLSLARAPAPLRGGAFPTITNSAGMRLVRIPAGTFTMGSPPGEKHRLFEQQHEVEITRAFWLGVHEVTQRQFQAVMGYNPSAFSADGRARVGADYIVAPAGCKANVKGMSTKNFPVENVSWEEANEFCDKLSAQPAEKKAGRKYRLPTEAEWEHACRGGARAYQVFHLGNSLSSRQANFNGYAPYGGAPQGTCLARPCQVGSYAANGYGLYDMHGNVKEWCADWYADDYYQKSPRRDPQGPAAGESRVIRGGGWNLRGEECRSASRACCAPATRPVNQGFRVVLVDAGR
jgi:formylglycine-generating enzyme required for sulfatase activity